MTPEKSSAGMWVAIHMAKSEQAAEEVRALLADEGFVVRLHAVYRTVASPENLYEVRVLRSEMQEARALLIERGL